MNMLRIKNRKGFSLVEMIVVLTLLAIVGIMTVRSLDSSSQATRSNLEYSRAQTALRTFSYELERSISQARPLEDNSQCQTLDSSSADNCLSFSEKGAALAYASPFCLAYYSYPSGSETAEIKLNVVRVAPLENQSTILLEQYPADATPNYTADCSSLNLGSATRSTELGRTIMPQGFETAQDAQELEELPAPSIFSYSLSPVPTDGFSTEESLKEIKWVEVNAQVQTAVTDRRSKIPSFVDMEILVDLPGARYLSRGN